MHLSGGLLFVGMCFALLFITNALPYYGVSSRGLFLNQEQEQLLADTGREVIRDATDFAGGLVGLAGKYGTAAYNFIV